MIDCKITENYLKEKERICETTECRGCPFEKNGCTMADAESNAKECIDAVQKWSDAHPIKTYLIDFLEKYPNASRNKKNGMPMICPSDIGFHDIPECELQENCMCCWNQPIEETSDER